MVKISRMWEVQNKVRPGAYINFKAVNLAEMNVNGRNVMTMPVELDWGPSDKIFEITSESLADGSCEKMIGINSLDSDALIFRQALSNCATSLIYRLNGDGGKKAFYEEKGTWAGDNFAYKYQAKYIGIAGDEISIKVIENEVNNTLYDVITYYRGVEKDRQTVARGETIRRLKASGAFQDNDWIDVLVEEKQPWVKMEDPAYVIECSANPETFLGEAGNLLQIGYTYNGDDNTYTIQIFDSTGGTEYVAFSFTIAGDVPFSGADFPENKYVIWNTETTKGMLSDKASSKIWSFNKVTDSHFVLRAEAHLRHGANGNAYSSDRAKAVWGNLIATAKKPGSDGNKFCFFINKKTQSRNIDEDSGTSIKCGETDIRFIYAPTFIAPNEYSKNVEFEIYTDKETAEKYDCNYEIKSSADVKVLEVKYGKDDKVANVDCPVLQFKAEGVRRLAGIFKAPNWLENEGSFYITVEGPLLVEKETQKPVQVKLEAFCIAKVKEEEIKGEVFELVIKVYDDTGSVVVKTLPNLGVDQTIQELNEAGKLNNDYIKFDGVGLLTETGDIYANGIRLKGGTDRVPNYTKEGGYFALIKQHNFNTMCLPQEDGKKIKIPLSIKKIAVNFIREMRDKQGIKSQIVLYNYADDNCNYEGVISTRQGYKTAEEEINAGVFTAYVAGLTAGSSIYQSNTFKQVENAIDILYYEGETPYSNTEIERFLTKGYFLLTKRRDLSVVCEKDINTLHKPYPPDTNYNFSKNRIIRTLDEINNTIKDVWEQQFVGKVSNNDKGRDLYKAALIRYLRQLETLEAIQNFDPADVSVKQGEHADAVVVDLAITPVDSMEILYLQCVVQ